MSRDAWQFRVETRTWLQCTRNAFLLQEVFARGKARTKSAAVNGALCSSGFHVAIREIGCLLQCMSPVAAHHFGPLPRINLETFGVKRT
jgi:hypothetical protein